MNIHFIAIGGSVMHNLALALHSKGHTISGSDDEIFDPAKTRLAKKQILPESWGWFPEKLDSSIDAVILGMHARLDNHELLRAQELKLPIYSFPEFIYEQTKDKKRIAIAGSHGKTTTTSMIMHVLRYQQMKFDYLVGAQLEGFEMMVGLSHQAKIAVFEGDEYLSSPLDKRPKFYHYQPQILVLTGIAWDHINVFPTKEIYLEAFSKYLVQMKSSDVLIYNDNDEQVVQLAEKASCDTKIAYAPIVASVNNEFSIVTNNVTDYQLNVFGNHNLSNLSAALQVCKQLGISEPQFFNAMQSFKGAARRMQLVKENTEKRFYFDFAHSPSKLKATIQAVKNQFPDKKLLACMELHTFSSLNANFLSEYAHTMDDADMAIVYYSEKVLKHKNMEMLEAEKVKTAFAGVNLKIVTTPEVLQQELVRQKESAEVVLLMTSGNLGGLNIQDLANIFIPD
jgi:UDP-N-acetylmuramate: L-alanyl-gamma-D-glutamyl-meso-diaminopimelate ligase